MSRYKYVSWLFVACFTQLAGANMVSNDLTLSKDDCKDVCSDNLFLLPLVNNANEVCQRGCRLFNIIEAKGDINLNKTSNDCYASCTEAYKAPEFEACRLGCNEMLKRKEQSELSSGFVLYIEQEGQGNVMVVQPELDQVEMDILADPGLRGQLDFGYSIEYKIPETHIRTMPINDGVDGYGIPPDMTLKQYQPAGDWLDCASRNSGIPRWILIAAILVAVLLGIWLIFASEKREPMAAPEAADTETLVNHMEYFTPPPKYSPESEKV